MLHTQRLNAMQRKSDATLPVEAPTSSPQVSPCLPPNNSQPSGADLASRPLLSSRRGLTGAISAVHTVASAYKVTLPITPRSVAASLVGSGNVSEGRSKFHRPSSRHLPRNQQAIERALQGILPEVSCIDVHALRFAEDAYHELQALLKAPPSSPPELPRISPPLSQPLSRPTSQCSRHSVSPRRPLSPTSMARSSIVTTSMASSTIDTRTRGAFQKYDSLADMATSRPISPRHSSALLAASRPVSSPAASHPQQSSRSPLLAGPLTIFTAPPRKFLLEHSVKVSKLYCDLGMACLTVAPRLAYECIQRAVLIAPAEDPSHSSAIALGNLGAAHLQLDNPTAALRYLERAVHLQAGLPGVPAVVHGRVCLNLCAAHTALGQYYEALDASRYAATTLKEIDQRQATAGPSALTVMRAIAHHNISACHEHLRQFEPALAEAQYALRLAQLALPLTDVLLSRLQSVAASIEQTLRSKHEALQKIL